MKLLLLLLVWCLFNWPTFPELFLSGSLTKLNFWKLVQHHYYRPGQVPFLSLNQHYKALK